jgi:hypothetical protein
MKIDYITRGIKEMKGFNAGVNCMPEERSSKSHRSSSGSVERSSSSMKRGENVFKQGEKPGAGEYRCISCNTDWRVTLGDDMARLPPCGQCGPGVTAEYEKIGRGAKIMQGRR